LAVDEQKGLSVFGATQTAQRSPLTPPLPVAPLRRLRCAEYRKPAESTSMLNK